MIRTIETIMVKCFNPAVYLIKFTKLNQKENTCKLYFLTNICWSGLWISKFFVSNWFTIHLQRINLCEDYTVKPLQSVILTKTGYLRSLEEIVKHAEAFESAFWYQAHLHQQTDSAFWISAYKKSKSNSSKPCSCCTTNHTNSQCSTVCLA